MYLFRPQWGKSFSGTEKGASRKGPGQKSQKVSKIYFGHFSTLFALVFSYHGPLNGPFYQSSKWHYRQRNSIFELVMQFIADTDENYIRINFW